MHSPTIRIWFMLVCALTVCTLSCKKFLTTYSQNNSFIESATDLNELLIGEAYFDYRTSVPPILYSMDDDLQLGKPENGTLELNDDAGFHYWQAQPRMSSDGRLNNTDRYFNSLYNKISRINTILLNVPLQRKKGEPAKTLDRISGEAHFLRAYYYFMLVNLYGKPYTPSTASIDFGVPLKTDPAIDHHFVSRSSTQQVYDQIIADLLDAEKELADANTASTIRANMASAQALLSRVYLFMENYEQALRYADKVLRITSYQLTDLNKHPDGKDFLTKNSSEVIFTMGKNAMATIMSIPIDIPLSLHYKPSDDLWQSYTPQDLRKKVFFLSNSKGQIKGAKKREYLNAFEDDVSDMFLLRLSEVYLNKAEALAALDRFEEARTTLQEFRKNRFKPTELPAISSAGVELMQKIRDERRLELCWESHRWFDLRRYAVNTPYPFSKTIQHRSIVFSGSGYIDNGYYELGPYEQDAAAYIVPIANDEIEFNQGLLINAPRPERPLKK